jgi:subtilisin family serine protease
MYRSIYLLTLLMLMFFSGILYPQTEEQRENLLKIARETEEQWKTGRAEAESLAVILGIPIRFVTEDGRVNELQKFEYGFPVYYETDNSLAAQTIATSKTYVGEIPGFNLSGTGQILGVWDGSAVLPGHQEFGGRVFIMDGSSPSTSHATAVGGTMVAAGVNTRAKGMAYEATLHSYDFSGDISELSNAAASGLKVSNHSYGTNAGWADNYFNDGKWGWIGDVNLSATEDYKFGFYGSRAVQWDNMLYNAQYLLACKSAGNQRGEGPSPGTQHWANINGSWTLNTEVRPKDGGALGYDCLNDERSTAKNTFVVGAVNGINGGYSSPSGVNMSSFSSWGPTDDGRIKPDVVADGVNLYTSTNTGVAQYTTISGTSFSTPSVAGSVGILLQQQAALYTTPFRAATHKGLIIHTTDECGQFDGPDYIYGWGLMNTLRAIKTMTLDAEAGSSLLIKELTLNQGNIYEYLIESNGTEPLRATISWTDPAGAASSPSLNNPAIKLVNDLDLRITGPGGTALPWILDRDNPTAAASKGDNIRDNVEHVIIPFPAAGQYTVKVSHKGNLYAGTQNYSLIVTGHVLPVPQASMLQLPANNSVDIITKPLFKWNRSLKGYDHQLQVSQDPSFTTIVLDSIISGVYVQLNHNLPQLSTLYWRVRGINSGGSGAWSDVWSFSTKLAIPSPPVLLSPENGILNVKNGDDLVWTTESTVETFTAQVSTVSFFPHFLINDSTVTATTLKLNNMTENKKYFWKVKGVNSSGSGDFSPANNFVSAVNAPDSLTAEHINETIKLEWKDNSSVETRYYILRKKGESREYVLLDSLNANSTTFTDADILSDVYKYKVYCAAGLNNSDTAEVRISTVLSVEDQALIPAAFSVAQNYPNPFNPSTVIKYGLPVLSNVKVTVFNTLGEVITQLVNSQQAAGLHELKWDAGNLSSGIYFYSIEASGIDGKGNFKEVRKMLLLK